MDKNCRDNVKTPSRRKSSIASRKEEASMFKDKDERQQKTPCSGTEITSSLLKRNTSLQTKELRK